jgi:hypothetical protein
MNLSKKSACWIIAAAAASLCAVPLQAQQEGEEKPKPAARVLLPLPDLGGNQQDDNANQDQGPQNLQPDNGPLTGVQAPTLGFPEMRHSYWVPGIQYSNTIFSSSVNPTANSGWTSINYVAGNLSLSQGWRNSSLKLNYSGGNYFSNDSGQGNGHFHQLALDYQIDERRWQLLFMEQFSYLPQSAFGFGASTGLSSPGIGGFLGVPIPGLQGTYVPNQSNFASVGPRYSSSSAAQLSYQVSARTSITLASVYGMLRFVEPGNIESNNPNLTAGYNYALSKKNTIGISYRFSVYQFLGIPQALGDHSAQLNYGRKITGRMALQLAAGPEITTYRIPISNKSQRNTVSGNATLTYAFKRGGVSLNYSHEVNGGGGVLAGSSGDQVGVSANRQLTRIWQGNLSFSYAKNAGLTNLNGISPPAYSSWYEGAGLNRPLGRETDFSIAYQAQNQNANLSPCSGPGCNTNYLVHQITLSFRWHTRPFVLR